MRYPRETDFGRIPDEIVKRMPLWHRAGRCGVIRSLSRAARR